MVKHQRVVVSSLPLDKAYEISILYFKNLGFFEIEQIPNVYIKFQRGSVMMAHSWRTKKMYLTLNFSLNIDKKVVITCVYDISAWVYEGENDIINIDREIQGFRKYLSQCKGNQRICPKCKREIPWDANICPYCGHNFTQSNKQCPQCKHRIPIDATYCPYCGYRLQTMEVNKNESVS